MIDFSGSGLPPQGYNVSGVSGGPLLIPTLTDKGLIWRFAGGDSASGYGRNVRTRREPSNHGTGQEADDRARAQTPPSPLDQRLDRIENKLDEILRRLDAAAPPAGQTAPSPAPAAPRPANFGTRPRGEDHRPHSRRRSATGSLSPQAMDRLHSDPGSEVNAEVLIKNPADMNLRPVTAVDLLHQGG